MGEDRHACGFFVHTTRGDSACAPPSAPTFAATSRAPRWAPREYDAHCRSEIVGTAVHTPAHGNWRARWTSERETSFHGRVVKVTDCGAGGRRFDPWRWFCIGQIHTPASAAGVHCRRQLDRCACARHSRRQQRARMPFGRTAQARNRTDPCPHEANERDRTNALVWTTSEESPPGRTPQARRAPARTPLVCPIHTAAALLAPIGAPEPNAHHRSPTAWSQHARKPHARPEDHTRGLNRREAPKTTRRSEGVHTGEGHSTQEHTTCLPTPVIPTNGKHTHGPGNTRRESPSTQRCAIKKGDVAGP